MEVQNSNLMEKFLPWFKVDEKAYRGYTNRRQEFHLSRLLYDTQSTKRNLYRILPSINRKDSLTIMVTSKSDGELNMGSTIYVFEMRYEENKPYLFGDKGDKRYSMREIFDGYKDMDDPIVADYSLLINHKCSFCNM